MDWPKVFRLLSKKYGWTPEQIGNLTPGQIKLYLDEDGSASGVEMNQEEWEEYLEEVRARNDGGLTE